MKGHLYDTSVWVSHFSKRRSEQLSSDLEANLVAMHPFVLGELLLGGLPQSLYRDLFALNQVRVAASEEIYPFIQRHRLQNQGIGWVDAHLLFSALSEGIPLQTLDRNLGNLWRRLA